MSIHPACFQLNEKPPAIENDWPVLSNFGELLANSYYSTVNQVGIRTTFNGWPTFTPDGRFIIGRSKQVHGFIMAGGCNAHGVSGSAGIGKHVAESYLAKNISDYVKSLSPDRFLDMKWSWSDAEKQARHIYETYYSLRK